MGVGIKTPRNLETERMYWESCPDDDGAEGRVAETMLGLIHQVAILQQRVLALEAAAGAKPTRRPAPAAESRDSARNRALLRFSVERKDPPPRMSKALQKAGLLAADAHGVLRMTDAGCSIVEQLAMGAAGT